MQQDFFPFFLVNTVEIKLPLNSCSRNVFKIMAHVAIDVMCVVVFTMCFLVAIDNHVTPCGVDYRQMTVYTKYFTSPFYTLS